MKLFRQFSFWNTVVRAMTIGFLALVLWVATTGFFALSSIPGIVAGTQGIIHKSSKLIDKTAEQIITNKNYMESKDTMDADVVIFGHTHFASSTSLNQKQGKNYSLTAGAGLERTIISI